MSDVYAEAFYHLVWATKMRERMIVPRQEMAAAVHALNGMPDHVHLVCSVPASISVSEFMKRIKGGSSHFISHHSVSAPLRWQPGYGMLTFAAVDLPRVSHYVDNQKKHHRSGLLSPKMEHIPSVPEALSVLH